MIQLILVLISAALAHLVVSLPAGSSSSSSYQHSNSIGDNPDLPKTIAIATNGHQIALTKHVNAKAGKGFEFPRGKAKDEEEGYSRTSAERELKEETGYIGRARLYPAGFRVYDGKAWIQGHIVDITGRDDIMTDELRQRKQKLVPFGDVRETLKRDEMKRMWDLAYPHVYHMPFEAPPEDPQSDVKYVEEHEWIYPEDQQPRYE